jgi:hypothetical protein
MGVVLGVGSGESNRDDYGEKLVNIFTFLAVQKTYCVGGIRQLH